MRIILATGIFKPEIGGPAFYVPQIAEELIKLGHQVAVISYSDKNKYDFDKSLPYPITRIKRSIILLNYYRYFRTVFKKISKYDLIYTFDYFSAGIPSLLATKLKGKKLVIRNGGDLIWERYLSKANIGISLKNYYKEKLYRKNLFKFIIAKIVFRFSDLLIFTTKLQGELFKKYYKINSQKIKYIKNPLFIKKNCKNRNKFNKEIIWAGRMVAKNNIIRLVNVFCDLNQDEYKLVLVGEGELKDELSDLVKSKNCGQVIFKDKMLREELKLKMINSYAMVFPSYTDISPNTVLDCLALDVPFIITQEHGFYWLQGKVVEFNPISDEELKEAFVKLMNKDFYKDFQENLLRINYNNYTFNQATQDTVKLFKKLLK